MIWNVDDDGRVLVRLRASGEAAARLTRGSVEDHFGAIENDLSTNGIEIVTQDIQMSRRPKRLDAMWRADIPPQQVGAVREYLMRLAKSEAGL